VPAGASQPVDHAFASFSWPVHFFADYAGEEASLLFLYIHVLLTAFLQGTKATQTTSRRI
jgi:hypothetical protein